MKERKVIERKKERNVKQREKERNAKQGERKCKPRNQNGSF